MNETQASTLQKLLASRTKTDEAQRKAAPPKESLPKAAMPKATPPKEAPPKATPPKEALSKAAPPKASPAKAALPKPTPAKETSKQIPVPPNMSPDNLLICVSKIIVQREPVTGTVVDFGKKKAVEKKHPPKEKKAHF